MSPQLRRAYIAGKQAVIAHRLHGGPPPEAPYSRASLRSRHWFQRGADRAARLIDQLECPYA